MRNILIFGIIVFISACGKENYDMNDYFKMYGGDTGDVRAFIEQVSDQIIYFGHQSVGENILGGIEEWKRNTGATLNIVESRVLSSEQAPAFAHYRVGQNGDPRGKIDDFLLQLEEVPADKAGIAFFKLCYVDINESTDVEVLFEYYKEKMLYAREHYPTLKIILVTAPVTGIQTGLKATAKKLLNRQPAGVLENIRRDDFNERIRGELSDSFSIFDLAAIETTLPDGSRNTYRYKGKEYPCMPGFYSSDLGHLNDFGAKIVSHNLLAFLSEIG